MRKRFGLPGSRACCGSMSLTDYARWLLCWPWALAQEVRTANLDHVDGEVLYSKVADDDHADSRKPLLVVSNDHDIFRATETVAVSQASPPNGHLVVVDDETTMAPPVQVVVVQQLEGDKSDESSVSLQGEMSNSSILTSVTTVREEDAALLESNRAVTEEDGEWRVEVGEWKR